MSGKFVTICEHCGTKFRVSETQLLLAGGNVRCGACLQVFNAAAQVGYPFKDNAVEPQPDTQSERQTARAADDESDTTTRALDQSNEGGDAAGVDVESESTPADTHDTASIQRAASPVDEGRDAPGASPKSIDDEQAVSDQRSPSPSVDFAHDSTSEAERDAHSDKSNEALPDSSEQRDDDVLQTSEAESVDTELDRLPRDPAVVGDDFGHGSDSAQFGSAAAGSMATGRERRRRSVLDVDESDMFFSDEERQRLSHLSLEPELPAKAGFGWKRVYIVLTVLVLLVAQYVYFRAPQLASNPDLRPLLEGFCSALGCEVPLYRDPKQLESRQVVVREHPERPDLLLIEAQIYNGAPYPQPLPDIFVELSDINGRIIGSRQFKSVDYAKGELSGSAGLVARRPVQIELEMFRPPGTVSSYRFELIPN